MLVSEVIQMLMKQDTVFQAVVEVTRGGKEETARDSMEGRTEAWRLAVYSIVVTQIGVSGMT